VRKLLDEFKAFLMQGNLILLAVAFVIGTASRRWSARSWPTG